MNDPNRTIQGAPPTIDPNRTRMGAQDANKTLMGTSPSLNATQTIKPIQCPVCKTFNPAGVMFCVDCGLIFDRALPDDAFGGPTVKLPCLVDPAGREHPIRPGVNSVGRQGDVMVEDSRVSRKHATITMDGGTIMVEDVGSTNGTTVGGIAITPGEKVELVPGTILSLGGYEFVLSLPGEGQKTAMGLSGRTAALSAAPSTKSGVFLVGNDTEYLLQPGENRFGRKDGNAVVIADPYVSGGHGIIEVEGGEVYLTDTGSTNGTVLNDARMSANMRTLIGPDDVIKLGALEFKIEVRV